MALVLVCAAALAALLWLRYVHRENAVTWLKADAAPLEMRAGLDPRNAAALDRTLAAMRQRLPDIETQRRQREAAEIARRVARVRQEGGTIAALRKGLTELALSHAGKKDDVTASAARIRLFTQRPCVVPTISDELSRYLNVHEISPFVGRNHDLDYVVEPTADVVVAGCHFGSEPGELRLVGGPAGDGFIKLTLVRLGWSDDLIEAKLDPYPGYPDQPAQLVVVAKDGTTSDPMPVLFRQRRVVDWIDTFAHQSTLEVTCANLTSDDRCVGLLAFDDAGVPHQRAPFAAYHKQGCCTREWGTDVWTIKLSNDWTLWESNELGAIGSEWFVQVFSRPFLLMSNDTFGGFTTCTFFNDPGKVTNQSYSVESTQPYRAKIAIAWWVDWTCSGIAYAASSVAIVGPEGVPYW